MIKSKKTLLFIFTFLFLHTLDAQLNLNNWECSELNDCTQHCINRTDSLFGSPQNINILLIPNNIKDKCILDLAYDQVELDRSSNFAIEENALAAVNGGFFNMRKGGAVSFMEYNNQVITQSVKGYRIDYLFNGAIVIDSSGEVIIGRRMLDSIYINRQNEKAVMVAGPLLLENNKYSTLLKTPFVEKRHPRTAIGLNEDFILLLTIDGRSETAAGMNLYELQQFLYDLNCTDAINLDGGGSTTMCVKVKDQMKIINEPSDITGERPVANAILIKTIDP